MQLTHRTLLRGFLSSVLVIAGMIAGMRFASSQVDLTDDAVPIVMTTTDLSGEWIGTSTEDYGDFARYDYRVVFQQEENEIKGVLYLLRNDTREIYTETLIIGTIEGNTAFYSSEEILVIENANRDELCLVETTVTYDHTNGQDTLVGTWVARQDQDPACDTITGHIILTRQ